MILDTSIILKIFIFITFLFFNSDTSSANKTEIQTININKDKAEIFAPIVDTLLKRGIDSKFIINLINSENTKFDEKYIKINVTGYLQKIDYSHNYKGKSLIKTKEFLIQYDSLLTEVSNKYQVNKEIIVAILWVETKLGTYTGNNHIPSVFLSTALVNLPKYIEINISEIDSTKYSKDEYNNLVNKIYKRSQKKSSWAINELIAMYELEQENKLKFDNIYGSWAGAFGYSQFLPSSYKKWAVDGNNDNYINLFEFEDAVYSIANYLKVHGWNNNNEEQQRKAIFAYNNSNKYVDAVLILSKKLK